MSTSVLPPATVVDLLQRMVAFDTVNAYISGKPDPERDLAIWLEGVASALGFKTRRLPVTESSFNLLVTHEVQADAPWLLFESHMDTVSVAGMTIAPFAGEIRDGRMYGRGTCDTKGTGAAMLWAMRAYAAAGARPNNIALLFATDEEVFKAGAATFVKQHLATVGFMPRGVIVGEPTLLRAVVAHNGIVRWSITTHGVAVHSSTPWKGRSAISAMVKVIDAIETRYIPGLTATHELTGKAQCSINVIRGGSQSNIIPESCTIQLDRRVVPGESAETVLPAVEAILDELRAADPTFKAEQFQPFIDRPMNHLGGEAFAAHVCGVLAQQGVNPEQLGAGYSTDAADFPGAGIPAVVLGPGDISQAHTIDEWISLEQLHRGVEVYEALMRQPL